jgi:hypothetical protein
MNWNKRNNHNEMQDATIKKKVLTNIQIYWDVMPLGLVNGY